MIHRIPEVMDNELHDGTDGGGHFGAPYQGAAHSSIAAAPKVAELMAQELGHDSSWQKSQVAEFSALASGYLHDRQVSLKIKKNEIKN